MALLYSSNGDFDIFPLSGMVTVNFLSQATPELSKHVATHPDRDVVLDLSRADMVDSSALRLFVNLQKRLAELKRSFHLLEPSAQVQQVLQNTNLERVLSILKSKDELRERVANHVWNRYLPYCGDSQGLKRIGLKCAVCGSSDVCGYLVNPSAYDWEWQDGDPFPTSYLPGTREAIDVFSLLPIVCKECFMCSTDVGMFQAIDKDKVAIGASMDESTKALLAKGIKTRKKMMQLDVVMGDSYFEHPRQPAVSLALYTLAEEVARAVAFKRSAGGLYMVGFMNYLAIRYSDRGSMEPLINNCRSWLTKAVAPTANSTYIERARSYFILLVSAMNLGKHKDASQVYSDFSAMMETMPEQLFTAGIESPSFWYTQCQWIWEKELSKKSTGLQA